MSDFERFDPNQSASMSMRDAWAIRDEWAKRAQSEIDRLTRELAEAKAREFELERLCDATYVAKGADAYNHCCELTEQWDEDRLKKGLAPIYGPGELRSLCGWIESIRQLLDDAKARAIVDATMVRRALHYCPLDLPSPKKWDWMAKHITQALSARPEFPKESSNVE